MKEADIAYCKIYPPIGIARVGDSEVESGWFYGSEFPDQLAHKQPGFSFRDTNGRIKRHAARFGDFQQAGEPGALSPDLSNPTSVVF
jgi:hypothetical protein